MPSSRDIAEHIRLILERQDRPLAFETINKEDIDYTRVTIVAVDIPGLFTFIAGVLSAFNINILGAQIYTQKTAWPWISYG
ncbi:MAG: hypothetical protein R2864_04730 [Syntrophotaleaceae bacterium]